LAARQCTVIDIAQGKCVTSPQGTFRFALAALLKDSSLPLNIFDPNTPLQQAKIFNLCQLVRTYLRETFHLSTLDEMMVRWALTKESGLQDALKNPAKLAAIAAATKQAPDDIALMCWNDGDSKTLNSIMAALKISVK
jgi:hypothetical protein